MTHRLEADGIQLEFGNRRVLSDIYLKCETGEIVGLLGRNGQGKSCLMNIIYGSMPAADKSVRINSKPIPLAFKHPRQLSFLPQHSFIPSHLALTRLFSDFEIDWSDFVRHFPEFSGLYKSRFRHLSGGQRRLVEVYLIVKSNAQFSMLDEPFSHLMPLHIEKMLEILAAEKENKGFLITDQLFQHITAIADRLYLLANGKLHTVQSPADLEKFGYIRGY